MGLIHFPTWTLSDKIFTGMQVLALGSFAGETLGQNAGYSKFAGQDAKVRVPSRVGMTWTYTPGLFASAWFLSNAVSSNGREKITAALLTAHFGKRVLECLFLHRYSGTINGDAFIPISAYYGLATVWIAFQQQNVSSYGASEAWLLNLGLALNAIGQFGNFYHHWLLASLRSRSSCALSDGLSSHGVTSRSSLMSVSGSKSNYFVPQGAFFSFVTCPHYFFELVAWFGLACVTGQLNAFLVAADMTSYLAGRSMATTKWYRQRFEDYPAERRHLIPFFF